MARNVGIFRRPLYLTRHWKKVPKAILSMRLKGAKFRICRPLRNNQVLRSLQTNRLAMRWTQLLRQRSPDLKVQNPVRGSCALPRSHVYSTCSLGRATGPDSYPMEQNLTVSGCSADQYSSIPHDFASGEAYRPTVSSPEGDCLFL